MVLLSRASIALQHHIQNILTIGQQLLWRRTRFASDLIWTAASMTIMIGAGLGITVVVGNVYGSDGLGVYSVGLSVYMIGSVLATLGVHSSLLKHVPALAADEEIRSRCISAGLFLGLGLGLAVACLLWLSAPVVAATMRMPVLHTGLTIMALSVPFFTLNRILLSVLNGLRHMRSMAIMQSLRWVLLFGTTLGLSLIRADLSAVFWTFVLAEAVLLPCLFVLIRPCFRLTTADCGRWSRTHLSFGLKSSLTNVLNEVQIRVNVLILGIFLAPYEVGIYSLAQFVAQGVLYIPAIIQFNINPVMATDWAAGEAERLAVYLRQIMSLTRSASLAVAFPIWLGFPLLARLLFRSQPEFVLAWGPLSILLLGVTLFSGYAAIGALFGQTGMPEVGLRLVVYRLVVYVPISILLISQFGMMGGATAVLLMYLVSITLTRWQARKVLGIRL